MDESPPRKGDQRQPAGAAARGPRAARRRQRRAAALAQERSRRGAPEGPALPGTPVFDDDDAIDVH
eukprot:1311559-Pyramimonas_sp.AAC.1